MRPQSPRSILTTLADLFWPPPRAAIAPAAPPSAPAPSFPPAELPQVQQLVGKVTALTSSVAQDVGQHNANILTLSAELSAVAQSDPNAVAAIVCKLLVANRELQGRLQHAEDSLKDHSQQLKAAVNSARTDGLTGLLNRRALDEALRRCVSDFAAQGRPAALFMLDLDQFKKFNDTHGHLAGDEALVHAANVLRQLARPTDVVARYGGEEFAVVFPAETVASVRARAEQLRAAIGRRPVEIGDRQINITASAGLAELTPGDTVADWISNADRALYAAKSQGRDSAFQVCGAEIERIVVASPATRQPSPAANDPAPARPSIDAAALAADAFGDTGFVQDIARRIAEWRRGGATLSVILARLDDPVPSTAGTGPDRPQSPTRVAMQVARLCVREMDVVTRWQSDGLALLLPTASIADAKTVARRLRAALAANSGDGRPRLSTSIGIAEGIEGNDAKRVLERAWLALEAARAAGGGNIYVHDGLKSVGVRISPAR